MKKNILLPFIICFLVIIIFIWPGWLSDEHFSSIKKRATVSARLGGEWLINYEQDFLDPGILWVVKMINDKYCQLPFLDDFWKDRFKEFENHPVESAYQKLFNKEAVYQIDYELLKTRQFYFDDIIIPALYCEAHTIPDNTLINIFAFENASDYNLTHRYLAMLFLKNRNCLNKEEYDINSSILEASEKIIKEAKEAAFNDLYSERVAFLFFGGFENMIQDNWIEIIIENQEESGGWSTLKYSEYFGQEENPHTTALSVWALVEYTGKCPF